ncbi:CBM35 domain-containing protein [Cohnella herbarum]|uniref:CBM35 domain-containing protein n=1 Tax=Cohnella herbarum TaxID=2728023 RepID=UPI001C2B8ED5|nr:CBM35 domain-containing protein [Cohnella herbarum]
MRKVISFVLSLAVVVSLFCYGPIQRAKAAANYAEVVDNFGRTINDYGIDLLDWQGYLANPHVKLTVKPPSNAVFPVTITLNAQGTSRLMMDSPSTLSATGATKVLTFANSSEQKPFYLEIHPDRVGGPNEIENYTLSLNVAQNNGTQNAQTIPIRVLDQDDNAAPTMPLLFDYRFDTIKNYFSDPAIKAAAEQAVKDWFYFFDMASFDTVPVNAESITIPGDNWLNPITVTNNAAYNGMWIVFRGLNDPYSTGWPAANGNYHKRAGVQVPGPIHRSLGTILDFYPNFTPFTSLNDEEWYLTQMPGSSCVSNCQTDVLGLIMHEFGHAVAFHSDWAGMAAYKNSNGNDPEVVAYMGHTVPLDSSYHIPDTDPANFDRLSGMGSGRNNLFHPKRWMHTKLSLLIAENAGWKLNKNLTPFLAPSIVTASLPAGVPGQAYSQKLAVKGGIPYYDWTITSGTLPAGLSLDRFTGTISGTVSSSQPQSSYSFTVQLKDYDALSAPVTKSFTISTGGSTGTGNYEAETATVNGAVVYSGSSASGGSYVGGIDSATSYVQFAVQAPSAGAYDMTVRYANGTGTNSTHNLSVNGGASQTVTYPATSGWGQFANKIVTVNLNAGANTIRLTKGATGYAELDYIKLDPATANPTPTNIAAQGTATTSFVSSWESLAGLNDGYNVTSSNDRGHPVYGNWNNPGTTQWVQYDFSSSKTLSKIEVYWFDDDQGIDTPASSSVQYWNGTAWANVANPSGLGVLANQYNVTTFTPIATTKIRLNITAKASTSTGIEQWRVYGY